MPYFLTPSVLARYFFQECKRFLRYHVASREERRSTGIPDRAFDHSPLMRAILASGQLWEQEVVTRHLARQVEIAPGTGPLWERRWDEAKTLDHLRSLSPGRFLYQPTLCPPANFYGSFGLDPAQVCFRDNYPDLVEILDDPTRPGRRLLRVIDVKRADALHLSHRVQVLLYALQLHAILHAHGITDARVDLDNGAVWLGQQPAPETFELTGLRSHLERFLREDLPRLLLSPPQDAPWHLQFRCERCDYLDHCRAEMRRSNDLSRLTNLTGPGKQHLISLGVRTLPQLKTFLVRSDADAQLARCASLAGERPYLQARVEALTTGAPVFHGASAPLPRFEHLTLLLTLQQEPLGRSVYLAGLLLGAAPDILDFLPEPLKRRFLDASGKLAPVVLLARRSADPPSVRQELVCLLHDLLRALHDHNKDRNWKEKLSLQVYTHTGRDLDLLEGLLLDSLADPTVAAQAVTLLAHFQGAGLVRSDRHPGRVVAEPVVILQDALTRLVALPVDVSYTLPEVLQALGSKFTLQRRDHFHYPLGNGLRSEAVFAAWHQGKTDQLDSLARQASLYLYALRTLLADLRRLARPHLHAWAPGFQLPDLADFRHADLSRLAYLARYEGLLRCQEVRRGRAEPRAVQLERGLALALQAQDGTTFTVVGTPALEIEASPFAGWLLARDSDAGRLAQLSFNDLAWTRRLGPSLSPDRSVVRINRIEADPANCLPTRLVLDFAQPFADAQPVKGERFLLHPRHVDWCTERVVTFLRERDDHDDDLLRQLLRDPESAARRVELPAAGERASARLEDQLGLTDSQLRAFQAIRRLHLSAVWGPPGTGKTLFLATLILALAEAHARVGKPFRVLVTAFTHAAIENLLRKLADRRQELSLGAGLVMAKASRWESLSFSCPGVVVEDERLAGWLSRQPSVLVGATVHACLRARKKATLPPFDLVVLDEASQLRVAESAVPLALVAPTGRVVLAGDDLQLPPIVQGVYPAPLAGQPALERSCFELVRGRVRPGSPVVQMLTENHRMNDVLTSFAARLLYGPDYCCFSDEVARQRLAYHPGRVEDALVSACLAPAYPLVLAVLEGVQAGKENRAEAALVARLVGALRVGLRDRSGRPYQDDTTFFRDGVFVVSPHRAQNQAIRLALAGVRHWDAPPLAGTVDRMQGQEAEAVLISYGVSDPEFALSEAEFIYSVNRLNVALTRARSKSIVFLPAPLLEGRPGVVELPQAARGLSFMRELVRTVEAQSPGLRFDLGDGVRVRLLRADRPVV